ncbi:MAG: hypothetical protein AABX25_01030 [Nanoarchaeota archaeon]
MGAMCCDGVCSKCWGSKWIVFGLILVANQMWFKWDVWVVVGALLILKGVMKLAMPSGCGHCATGMPAKKGRK